MRSREILAMFTVLEGGKHAEKTFLTLIMHCAQMYPIVIGILPAKGYYYGLDLTTTVAPCTPLQSSACCSNPTTPDQGEIFPEQGITCGDTIIGDTTGAAPVNNGGLGFCGTSTGNIGRWYR